MRMVWNCLKAAVALGLLVPFAACGAPGQSTSAGEANNLFEVERSLYKPDYVPMETEGVQIRLQKGGAEAKETTTTIDLDGTWQMIEGGSAASRSGGNWSDAAKALDVTVPTTVTQALIAGGKLPGLDSIYKIGQLDLARSAAMKDWWFKRTFKKTGDFSEYRLVFEGTAYENTIYLNGTLLGTHKGLNDRYAYDVTNLIKDDNTLVVLAKSAASEKDWKQEVFIHSCNAVAPHQGIWRSVSIEGRTGVELQNPFIATRDAQKGQMDLFVTVRGGETQKWQGALTGEIALSDGGAKYSFSYPVKGTGSQLVHLQFTIPDPQLWWPAGMGKQNLYTLSLSMGKAGDAKTVATTFGIRTVKMVSTPQGEKKGNYNWQMQINGKDVFIKGACYNIADVLLYQSENKYEYLVKQMVNQNMNFIRAMGSGMPQPDEFYEACNKYGIMVYQEWPTAWDSIKTQPFDVLEKTVKSNMYQLRNNPSLVMWGGGNELSEPIGDVVDMMGKNAWELDGTRPFIKTTWLGGGEHDYSVWHQGEGLDSYLDTKAAFFGEFGQPSFPNYESVLKYLPDNTKIPANGFSADFWKLVNQRNSVAEGDDTKQELFQNLALPYTVKGSTYDSYTSVRDFITATQASQSLSLRHTIDLMRASWPNSTGTVYFRFTDEEPIAFWSVLDSYGSPKMSYYFVQDSYDPVHAPVLFSTFDYKGKAMDAPVYLLDDYGDLAGKSWQVKVTAYDAQLKEIKAQTYDGRGTVDKSKQVGTFSLTQAQTASEPLFVTSEILMDGKSTHRTFYWLNFQNPETQGAIFHSLPKTTLQYEAGAGTITVTNTGGVPAVGVYFENERVSDSMIAEDDYFWLAPGESCTVKVSITDIDGVSCWNGQ